MYKKWWILAAVACGTFMATLDSSIVNIALPTLTKALTAELYQIKWVIVIYLLVITCLLLPLGRVSDQYGRKKTLLLGFSIFTMGSMLCGFSFNLLTLLGSRMVQAIGAAMLMANGPAVITHSFLSGERGKALGTLAMVVSAGLISGPSIGGLLITTFGWPSIFFVNIPFGVFGIILVHRYLQTDHQAKHHNLQFDWGGAFIQVFILLFFMAILDPPKISISGSTPYEVSRLIIAPLIIILAVLFFKIEAQVKAPLFDTSLLKIRTFVLSNIASFFTFISYSFVSVLMPFYLEQVHHFAPDKAGLFMTAIPLTIFIVAPISGRLSDRFGGQELSFIGAMVGAIGLFAMAGALGLGIFEESSPAAIVLALSSIGLATGLFQSPNNNAILSAVPNHKLGVASALLAMIRNLGFGTGTTLATGFFAWRQNVTGNFVQSLHFAFWAAGFFAVGAMFASLGRKRGIERGVERGHVMSDDSEQNIHMDHVVTPKKEGL